MRRRAKAAKAKVETKRPLGRKSRGSSRRELEKRLAEALEQQAATSEILGVIRRSPMDAQPVFDVIIRNAVRLCDGLFGCLFRFDGERLHLVAHHNFTIEALSLYERTYPVQAARDQLLGPIVLEQRVMNVADVLQAIRNPLGQKLFGFRSGLGVPMQRDGTVIGAIAVSRTTVGLFPDTQVELLKTFADQAVIAIENVRLFTDLQARNREISDALDQQTATSEILRAISASPTDLQGVLDTVAASAARLCDSVDAQIFRVDGTMLRLAASYGELPKTTSADARPISRGSVNGRAVVDRQTIHVRDLAAESDTEFPIGKAYQKRFGHRTLVATPLLREGTPIGAITIRRMEVRSFSEKEIKLLETFANQAVIAIENVRLFTELQASNRELTEALERQTATADILRIIGTSPTDVQPIFDAIVRSASRLCDGEYAILTRYDGELLHLVAQYNPRPGAADETARVFPQVPRRETAVSARALLDAAIIHLPDVETEEFEPAAREYFDRIRLRAVVAVPMIHEGRSIGVVSVCRGTPGPFSRSQVDLLRTFADQAVIAIENTRLFSELQEKNKALTQAHAQVTETLEQQTATSEILRVISNSPSDLQPVFDTIVRNAVELCGAAFGGWHRLDSGSITLDAQYGVPADELAILQRDVFPLPISRDSATGRAMLDRAVVHIRDIRDDPGFRTPRLKTMQSYRTILAVPMIREGIPIGALALWRREVQPFSQSEIDLVETFADQAVIAIENVRLFRELEARNADLTDTLARETATSEILRVISRSPTDVQPVLAAIVRSAVQLCGGTISTLYRYDGHLIHLEVTSHPSGVPQAITQSQFPRPADTSSLIGRAIVERVVVNVADMETDPRAHPGIGRVAARERGFRSMLIVPMFRENQVVGGFTVGRAEPGEFSDTHIALLQTFADQAVIAIENVRLFTELQEKNRALTQAHAQVTASLEQQTATSEILRVISSSPTDVEPVFETILRSTNRLCEASFSVLWLWDGEALIPAAHANVSPRLADHLRTSRARPRRGGSPVALTALEQTVIHVPDVLDDPRFSPADVPSYQIEGARSILSVPMLREGSLVGVINTWRRESRAFTDTQVELLKTFADQAVIAIENVRLFTELQERNREVEQKSHQLAAASQHKSEFLANMSHELRTPLNAIIGFSEVLGERMFGELNAKQEEYLKDIHASGQHLLSLINDILDLSKIEAGRMELDLGTFDLPNVIDTAVLLIRERAGRRGIVLQVAMDEGLGSIQGDERKIKQVLLNLLSNAIKFTPEGGRIEIRATPVNGSVEVSVIDTGVGIAPEDQEAIFEEFRQVGTADKKVEGTGLGLALSRKFIELHGGRIWVESQVGVGSTFTFTIPILAGA